ncbi:MAG TPA: hypothetical protein PK167_05270, partial [Prolixibacteraceae bacterium]|nr:hypothetical protein [Prolixibacteraceae bacterium]
FDHSAVSCFLFLVRCFLLIDSDKFSIFNSQYPMSKDHTPVALNSPVRLEGGRGEGSSWVAVHPNHSTTQPFNHDFSGFLLISPFRIRSCIKFGSICPGVVKGFPICRKTVFSFAG